MDEERGGTGAKPKTAEAGIDQSVCLRPGDVMECLFTMLHVRGWILSAL